MSPYVTEKSYEIYRTYVALKSHFNEMKFDYFKNSGKTKAGTDAFERRDDIPYFYKLSKHRDSPKMILANLVENPKIWVGDVLTDHGQEVYKSWQRRNQRLTYQFKCDIKELNDDFNSNFIVKGGQHPHLLKLYMRKKITLETLVILTDVTKCLPYWERNISDTMIFGDINKRVAKYRPFVKYEEAKVKKILTDTYAN